MFDLLKEMGKVCEHRKMGLLMQDFHRKRFNEVYLVNKEQGEAHQKQWSFWTEEIAIMDKHIAQLHEKIRSAA